ncbi:MAG: transglutaminase family protein [Beijerinckiaceae bacterium]|nr:transglutaminase family protein [Beijerinckiaceae bacterium]MCZ8300599.1 transglutaminase family protein [Beijerinckiaceae bacterium]
MLIRYGYAIEIDCPQQTPLIVRLDVHPEFRPDITSVDRMLASDVFSGAPVAIEAPYADGFGNVCRRLVSPASRLRLEAQGEIRRCGREDARCPGASQHPPEQLPPAVLPFINGSRYCETDLLMPFAWERFGSIPNGWDRVEAITDFVHHHIRFDYQEARNTRTALNVFDERVGVCRDFTHLAVALCRALNIPARYCNGYLGDIGVPADPAPMDFSAWFEVYLSGQWWTFDARHNRPRIGRIVIARGLDAADVPMISSFGHHWLARFEMFTEEVVALPAAITPQAWRARQATVPATA